MDEIFKQYGSAIIAVTVISALIVILTLLIGTNEQSVIYTSFKNLIDGFLNSGATKTSALEVMSRFDLMV